MTEHPWRDCPNTQRIRDLERWQTAQNGSLTRIESTLDQLQQAEARRAGAEAMLKWILSVAGLGWVTGLVGLVLNLTR